MSFPDDPPPPDAPPPIQLHPGATPPVEPPVSVSERWRLVLSVKNREKLEALAAAYGITEESVLNVCVSDSFDAKVANMNDAEVVED